MLDGRIDEQGAVEELRKKKTLEEIALDAALQVKQEESLEKLRSPTANGTAEKVEGKVDPAIKKPRKLVEDEHREQGAVKWSVYMTYVKAS